MRRSFLSFLFLLATATLASSQSLPITGYELRVFSPGASAPISASALPLSDITCNLDPTPAFPSPAVNPTKAEWDDTLNAGKVCRYVPSNAPTSPLVILPFGSYEGALVASDAAGVSPESNKVPFLRAPLPAARTGLKFGK